MNMSDEIATRLEPAHGLLASYGTPEPQWLDDVPPPSDPRAIEDGFRGSLLWGAVGDALGRPTETRSWDDIRRRWGPRGVTGYHRRHGWTDGPIGTWTDDTQLTIEVARTIIEGVGSFDPARFADRLVDWLPHGRGVGRATRDAVTRLQHAEPWWTAGAAVNSAGNGAAMRAAPVGLLWALVEHPWPLARDAVLSALPTHTHPVGVAGAVAIAAGVACSLRLAGAHRPIDARRFLSFVADAIAGIEKEPTPLRSDRSVAATLHDRILQVGDLLDADPEDVFAELWSGAFALESVPAALYCFLRSPERPDQVVLTAANAGHDTDTIASMAGNLVGAHIGARRLRGSHRDLWDELEGRDEIERLGEQLLGLAIDHQVTPPRASPAYLAPSPEPPN